MLIFEESRGCQYVQFQLLRRGGELIEKGLKRVEQMKL